MYLDFKFQSSVDYLLNLSNIRSPWGLSISITDTDIKMYMKYMLKILFYLIYSERRHFDLYFHRK